MRTLLLTLLLTACTPERLASPEPPPAPVAHPVAPCTAPPLGVVATRVSEVVAAPIDIVDAGAARDVQIGTVVDVEFAQD